MKAKLLNRDLATLQFNLRVADEATRKRNTLGNQILFHGIASSNLNEFMQVRYPYIVTDEPENVELVSQGAISEYTELAQRFTEHNKKIGILKSFQDLPDKQKKWANEHFKKNIFPALVPITVDTSRPANIHNGMYIFLTTERRDDSDVWYIEIPACLGRFIPIPGKRYVITIEDLIQNNLSSIIHGCKILSVCPFAILRSANVFIQSDRYKDPYQQIQETLKERERSWITQLEIGTTKKEIIKEIRKILPMEEETIIFTAKRIRLSDLKDFPMEILQPDEQPLDPPDHCTFHDSDIFKYIRQKDRLCFHPFESYDDSVVRFIETAATDPDVASIRICLYRVSNRSRIIDALLKAADNGKLVVVLVELKARFDEKHNMQLATIMREGGIRIVYTKPNIKTHAKLCIVTRMESGKLRIYSHIGTGNYSESNSKVYTDYSYFTANQILGNDLVNFFNLLTSNQSDFKSKRVVYAPYNLKSTIIEEISHQMKLAKKKKPAQITIKCNALTDEGVAAKLLEAADAGVKLKLIIRSACIIQPQKNIQIFSVVGRFLEHSRVYVFGTGKDTHVYIGSADLMTRNLSRRNELLILMEVGSIRDRILKHIRLYLRDNVNRREIKKGYGYELIRPGKKDKVYNCHQDFLKEAKGLAIQ